MKETVLDKPKLLVGEGYTALFLEIESIENLDGVHTVRELYDDNDDEDMHSDPIGQEFINYKRIKCSPDWCRVISVDSRTIMGGRLIKKVKKGTANEEIQLPTEEEINDFFLHGNLIDEFFTGIIIPENVDLSRYIYNFESEADMNLFIEMYRLEFGGLINGKENITTDDIY